MGAFVAFACSKSRFVNAPEIDRSRSTVDRVPAAVETVSGNSFSTFPGGKGANQAACVGMLGGNCIFLGKVGDDLFGGLCTDRTSRDTLLRGRKNSMQTAA